MTAARFVVNAARRPGPPPGAGPGPVTPPAATVQREAGPAPIDRAGGRLPAARIAVWQAAVVVGFAGTGRGTAVTVGTAVTAVLVLVLSAVRVRGTWLSTLVFTLASFVLRRRARDGDWLPLPRGSVVTPDGFVAGRAGLTLVTRTGGSALPRLAAEAGGPELEVRLVAHLGPQRPGAWLTITARRSPEHDSDEALRVALDNALRRLRRTGPAPGPRVLDATELRATVRSLAHAGEGRESWTGWRSGPVAQVCLGVRAARPEEVLRLLRPEGGAAVTVALHRSRTGPGIEGVLRVAALPAAAAERAVTRVTDLGTHLGVRLDRLDGRHGPAVLASLPIGGPL